MPDLSILITARNEEFLSRTCQDVLEHAEADTEIIVVIDGQAAGPTLPVDPRLRVITLPESVGQRAAVNLAARNSRARYVMKLDAHCAVEQGFDGKLLAAMNGHDNWTILPAQKNLWVFSWVCKKCGLPTYMGPYPKRCQAVDSNSREIPNHHCDGKEFDRVMTWKPRPGTTTDFWIFDDNLHFQYRHSWNGQRVEEGELAETMSILGACWMMTRQQYSAIGGLDEKHGSWGQMGTEISCKTWLSGGRMITHRGTWYAHMFRTREGEGFGFPYQMRGKDRISAQDYSKDLWMNDRWPGQKLPLAWLVNKFKPLLNSNHMNEDGTKYDYTNWHSPEGAGALRHIRNSERRFVAGKPYVRPISKGIIYYTDNQLDEAIARPVRERLIQISRDRGLPITTAALKHRLDWGAVNKVLPSLKRGPHAMFKQILCALEHSHADVIFFCEHDVLYAPGHFDFTPPDPAKVYYNLSLWQVRYPDGHAVYWDAKRVSQLCGYRDVLIAHYRKRLALVEKNGYSMAMGYEPGSHNRAERVDNLQSDVWRSELPNLDIKHGGNLSPTKWALSDFRTAPTGWQEREFAPGWEALGVVNEKQMAAMVLAGAVPAGVVGD